MTALLHKDEVTELWECEGHIILLALPNWGTMGVYAQVWSSPGARWELLWHLEKPAIVKALREKGDVVEAVKEDRKRLLDVAEKILGGGQDVGD